MPPLTQALSFYEWLQLMLQASIYLIVSRPLRFLYQADRRVPQGLYTVKAGTLFVSNHQSMADPFLVLSHIPIKAFFRSLPFSFPVDSRFYRKWYLRGAIAMLGGYDVGATKIEKLGGLLQTRALLKQGRTVFLFPEGRINKEAVGDFQRGIEFFLKNSQGVIFVQMQAFSMHWTKLTATRPVLKFSEIHTFYRNERVPSAQELRSLLLGL